MEGESGEEGEDAVEGGDEGLALGEGVVGGEGGADGAFDAEGFHQGLGAMVACADGYAEFVEEHSGVVMVGFTDKEGY